MDLKAEKTAAYDLADRIASLDPFPDELPDLTRLRDALRFAAYMADRALHSEASHAPNPLAPSVPPAWFPLRWLAPLRLARLATRVLRPKRGRLPPNDEATSGVAA